jgi:hypothetical protein
MEDLNLLAVCDTSTIAALLALVMTQSLQKEAAQVRLPYLGTNAYRELRYATVLACFYLIVEHVFAQ